MAGLGETCTHIAAVLFYLEAISQIQGTEICTQKECGWLIPSYMKTVEYQAVKNIDFTSASGKKRKFSKMMEDDSPLGSFDETISSEGSPPTNAEMEELFKKLSLVGTKQSSRYKTSHILSYSSIFRQIYSKVIPRCVFEATKITSTAIISSAVIPWAVKCV